jgi:tetratricopeptide (TPR) repeat protein
MKKIGLIIVFIAFIFTSFSQKNVVVTAYMQKKNGKLDKAKEAIDKAILHEKTMADAKTWYYRGNIYIDIYNSDVEEYKNLDKDALNTAYESFLKSIEYDTKNEYKVDIFQKMPFIAQSFFNEGAQLYNKGISSTGIDTTLTLMTFGDAQKFFQKSLDVYAESGALDTLSMYYLAYTANLSKHYDVAKKNFVNLAELNYPEPSIYSSLANIYMNYDGDAVKAEEVLKTGMEKYPEDQSILFSSINFYLDKGKTQEALDLLEIAAELPEANETIFYAIGVQYTKVVEDTTRTPEEKDDAFDKAVDAYIKAMEINPKYFDANYNMGALYVNKAAEATAIAIDLPISEQAKYDALIEEANMYLEKALPYVETANSIQPDDIGTLVSLREIYTRLKMEDKRKAVNDKIDSLK